MDNHVEAAQRLDSRTVPVKEAFRQIGCGKTAGFDAIKAGTFPVPVFRVGKRMYIARAALDRLLGERDVDGKLKESGE